MENLVSGSRVQDALNARVKVGGDGRFFSHECQYVHVVECLVKYDESRDDYFSYLPTGIIPHAQHQLETPCESALSRAHKSLSVIVIWICPSR